MLRNFSYLYIKLVHFWGFLEYFSLLFFEKIKYFEILPNLILIFFPIFSFLIFFHYNTILWWEIAQRDFSSFSNLFGTDQYSSQIIYLCSVLRVLMTTAGSEWMALHPHLSQNAPAKRKQLPKEAKAFLGFFVYSRCLLFSQPTKDLHGLI